MRRFFPNRYRSLIRLCGVINVLALLGFVAYGLLNDSHEINKPLFAIVALVTFICTFLPYYLARLEEIYSPEQVLAILQQPSNLAEQEIAFKAMRAANVDSSTSAFVISDIGLMLYCKRQDRKPVIIRETPIPIKMRYLRPFVELQYWLRWRDKATTITIEIRNTQGTLYRYETAHQWNGERKHTIIPPTWVDIRSIPHEIDGEPWWLHVLLDGQLLAHLPIQWSKYAKPVVEAERHLDGEISPDLQQLLAKEQADSDLSLGELLTKQNVDDY